MKVETILLMLGGVRPSKDGWMALCPAHADKNPSLSVREENRRVLLHCFAGCSFENICDALGIGMGELFAERCRARQTEPPIVRTMNRKIVGLRSCLTSRERDLPVTVVQASRENPDPAIARALALAVEGELVQVVFEEKRQ